MAYFAELDENNIVKRVIVADQDFINSGNVGDSSKWVETFEGLNYAGIGFSYEPSTGLFKSPKPFNSWSYDNDKHVWKAPKVKPVLDETGDDYLWDESKLDWIRVKKEDK